METEAEDGPQVIAGRKYPSIPAGQVGQLEEIARTMGVTLTSALRSVVLTALRPYLPEQPVIGCVHGNRERPEVQPIIGLLSDHLPVRADLSGSPSFLDLITRVHDAVRTARRHQAPSGLIASAVPSLPLGEQMFEISINNMRHTAPLAGQVTAPDGSTVRFSVRDVAATELWPRIRHPFSGGVRLGYQLRRTLSGELSGEIWGHVPAFQTTTIDALGRAFAETASRIVSDPRRDIKTYAPLAGRRHR
jgi:non-ribosomal peptide synthetase component F